MVEVKIESHKVGVTSYQLTSLSFHVNRPSHSWDTAYSKFDLENPRARSWVRWMLKVTTWVHHSIDSHPFCSMSIGHPITEIRLFKIWPWKSKVKVMSEVNIESHNMGPSFYRLTSLLFHVNRLSHSWDERERLSLSAFLRTEDIGVHIVHISCVIITYTLQ